MVNECFFFLDSIEMTGGVVLERQVLSTTYTSSKNNDKSDVCLRREHPPYDVSTPERGKELTIEI